MQIWKERKSWIRKREVWQDDLTLLRHSWWARAQCNGIPVWSSCSYYWTYWNGLFSSPYWDLNCQTLGQYAATLHFTARLSGTWVKGMDWTSTCYPFTEPILIRPLLSQMAAMSIWIISSVIKAPPKKTWQLTIWTGDLREGCWQGGGTPWLLPATHEPLLLLSLWLHEVVGLQNTIFLSLGPQR